jgi:hypothetical protein
MRTALTPFAPVFAEDTTGAVFWLPPAPVDGAAACFFFAFWAIFTGSSFSRGSSHLSNPSISCLSRQALNPGASALSSAAAVVPTSATSSSISGARISTFGGGGGGPAGICGVGVEVLGGDPAGICGDRNAVLGTTRWMQGLPELLTDAPRSWQIFSKVSVVVFLLYIATIESTFLRICACVQRARTERSRVVLEGSEGGRSW